MAIPLTFNHRHRIEVQMKYKFDQKKISLNLKSMRIRSGLTQAEVADTIGIEPGTVSNYENTHILPPLDKLIGMCDLYNCTIEDVIMGKR